MDYQRLTLTIAATAATGFAVLWAAFSLLP